MKSFHLDILPMLVFILFLVIHLFVKSGDIKHQDQQGKLTRT